MHNDGVKVFDLKECGGMLSRELMDEILQEARNRCGPKLVLVAAPIVLSAFNQSSPSFRNEIDSSEFLQLHNHDYRIDDETILTVVTSWWEDRMPGKAVFMARKDAEDELGRYVQPRPSEAGYYLKVDGELNAKVKVLNVTDFQ